jgi:hypothetical protein
MRSGLFVAAITASLTTGALAQSPRLAVEEFMVGSCDPGIELYVRNKRPADMAA